MTLTIPELDDPDLATAPDGRRLISDLVHRHLGPGEQATELTVQLFVLLDHIAAAQAAVEREAAAVDASSEHYRKAVELLTWNGNDSVAIAQVHAALNPDSTED